MCALCLDNGVVCGVCVELACYVFDEVSLDMV